MIKLSWFSPRECFNVNFVALNLSVNLFTFVPLTCIPPSFWKKSNAIFLRHFGRSWLSFENVKLIQFVQFQNLMFQIASVEILVYELAYSLREKCPNTEFFLFLIFPYSARMKENANQKKLHIWTLFMQC